MYEVLHHYRERIKSSPVLEKLGLTEKNYFVVSAHREENIDNEKNFENLVETLNIIAATYQQPILFSTHPRTRKKIEEKRIVFDPAVQLSKPLCFTEYVRLQQGARAVLSDSGTITEESSILGFPALNIREAHERPEGFEEASVMLVGLAKERVMQGLAILEGQQHAKDTFRIVADYDVPNVAEKVVRIILSYTDYVNRTVWSKTE